MKRQEKIESIRRGEAVIKNDMQGDERCLEVLNECETTDFIWKTSPWTIEQYFGINKYGVLFPLQKSQLNARPQILMSELAEIVSNGNNNRTKEQIIHSMISEMPFAIDLPTLPYIYEAMEIYRNQPTEQKEVFTVADVKKMLQYCKPLKISAIELADKLNKMAFEAYKN